MKSAVSGLKQKTAILFTETKKLDSVLVSRIANVDDDWY